MSFVLDLSYGNLFGRLYSYDYGNPEAAFKNAATYTAPHLANNRMEPADCLANVTADKRQKGRSGSPSPGGSSSFFTKCTSTFLGDSGKNNFHQYKMIRQKETCLSELFSRCNGK